MGTLSTRTTPRKAMSNKRKSLPVRLNLRLKTMRAKTLSCWLSEILQNLLKEAKMLTSNHHQRQEWWTLVLCHWISWNNRQRKTNASTSNKWRSSQVRSALRAVKKTKVFNLNFHKIWIRKNVSEFSYAHLITCRTTTIRGAFQSATAHDWPSNNQLK